MSDFSLRKGDIVTVVDSHGCQRRAVVAKAFDSSTYWGIYKFDETTLIFINEPFAEAVPDPELSGCAPHQQ